MNKRQARGLKRQVLKQYKDFVNLCIDTGKQWDKKALPLTFIKTALDKMELKTDDKTPEVLVFIDAHNKLWGSLYRTLQVAAKKMNSKSVSIEYIKHCVVEIVVNYKKGFDGKQ